MKKRLISIALLLAMLSALTATVVHAEPPYEGYSYSRYPWPSKCPPAYEMSADIDTADYGIGTMEAPADMYVTLDTNDIYLLDSGVVPRIIILNSKFEFVKEIKEFSYNGEPAFLNKPEGIFVSTEKQIYICDTENGRIVRCDENGVIDKIIDRPAGLDLEDAELEYKPSKMQIDNSGRIYVVARAISKGFIELDPDGKFLSFFGAPKVKMSTYDQLMRMLATKKERDSLVQLIPTEYANITMDANGFLFGCIKAQDTTAKKALVATFRSPRDDDSRAETTLIRKLSMDGEDILVRRGVVPTVGDVVVPDDMDLAAGFIGTGGYEVLKKVSSFRDITSGKFGTYSAIDDSAGRVFTYDEEGNLLFVFGNISTQKGTFKAPIAIAYVGDSIAVLDYYYKKLIKFDLTDYGAAVLDASAEYFKGNYEIAEKKWGKVLNYNSNMNQAFIGVGKAMMRTENYADALENFKLSYSDQYYSKALKGYLEQTIGNTFTFIFFGIVGLYLVWQIIRGVRRFRRFLKDGVRKVL